ncbi:MAG: ParM/StbA family protein [Anaerolineae bacterium]|jgi:hypothetical protein|nr:ParM/StbA family protein [Anaerolineae bacterium]MBT7325566.1 ParM/StbA family protein [Anaerolineae bacterium]
MTPKEQIILGEDLGMGANKLYGVQGGFQLPSQVAINGAQKVTRMVGLRSQKVPLHIRTQHGSFYVGPGAHDWGRPVENLDYDRLIGAPEMHALFYGSMTHFMKTHATFDRPLSLIVGMPLEPLTGPDAKNNVKAVQKWMEGHHEWQADGKDYQVEIAQATVTSQPVGALFDYLLDEEGHFIKERKGAFKQEVGIISVGFNTVELLVVRDKQPVQRFTAGTTAGVRRLLEIVNSARLYSLGELDSQLRHGSLDVKDALPVWEREVTGVIDKHWGDAWKRFAKVLLVGGGATLLKKTLPYRFNGKAFVPKDPVLSISRGLYKLGKQIENRKRS